ncbi:MAG: kynureninase [Gammaproteobacteria bacterium]|nr:kynureninase [Gammaproteobacteria bacterium]
MIYNEMQIPDHIIELDKNSPLESKKSEFLLPDDTIYMDGNSLGPTTKSALDEIETTTKAHWRNDLISSWNKHSWITLPQQIGEKIAPLLGAKSSEVIGCDSISVNLFKLLSAALKINHSRNIIVSESGNFPTDLYIAEGLESLLGKTKCSLKTVEKSAIIDSLNTDVAVLMLTHVDFRSGEKLDIRAITKAAHDKGILVLWDLAHSAGALKLDLDHDNVDFAVGCGYKYLNGGPGAPAFVYVAERHIKTIEQPLRGWMGHTSPFDFTPSYKPATDISKMLCGTPSVISMASLNGALDVFQDVDMAVIEQQAHALKQTFLSTLTNEAITDLKLITPTNSQSQGSQLSFTHEYAFELSQALIANKIIVDFRAPNVLRLGFTPLYLEHRHVYLAATILTTLLKHQEYLKPQFRERKAVT